MKTMAMMMILTPTSLLLVASLDPGSYSLDKSSSSNDNNIVSYVSESLATKITNKVSKTEENVCTYDGHITYYYLPNSSLRSPSFGR